MRDIQIRDIFFIHILNEEFSVYNFYSYKRSSMYLDSKKIYLAEKVPSYTEQIDFICDNIILQKVICIPTASRLKTMSQRICIPKKFQLCEKVE